MARITIDLSDEEISALKERGEENFLSTKEQIEDIVRRSVLSYRNRNKSGVPKIKIDDKLVSVFSRDPRGRKRKK